MSTRFLFNRRQHKYAVIIISVAIILSVAIWEWYDQQLTLLEDNVPPNHNINIK